MADYTRELKQLLTEVGCRFHRQGKGDHEIWYSPITNRYFPVDSAIKSRHTANGVLKGRTAQKVLTAFASNSSYKATKLFPVWGFD